VLRRRRAPQPPEVISLAYQQGEAIPGAVTALLTLPMMALSRSRYPAIIVAALDLAWLIFSWIQAKVPAKPEPVSRDLPELRDAELRDAS
jgi:hypothetical protein